MTEYSDTYLKQLVAITKEIVKEIKSLRKDIQTLTMPSQLTKEEQELAKEGILIESVYIDSPLQRLEEHLGDF